MIKKNVLSITQKIVIPLLLAWFVLSFSRTLFNFSKIITEEVSWLGLNENQKKTRLFGNLHIILSKIQSVTPVHSRIIFFSTNDDVHYLGIYYLYPRLFTHVKYSSLIDCTMYRSKYDYLVVYSDNNIKPLIKNCAHVSARMNVNEGGRKANSLLFTL